MNLKDLFTPKDSVTVTLTGGIFDLFDGHCNGQNGLHSNFAIQRNICYGDGVAWCERALRNLFFTFQCFQGEIFIHLRPGVYTVQLILI